MMVRVVSGYWEGVLRVGAEGGAVGREGHVFGHHQFDLVAAALDVHAGVSEVFAQFFLLVVHVAADARADGAAGQRGIARAFAAVAQCADDAADGGAAEAEGGGFAGFLRAVGVGDAAAESKGCGNSGDDERVKQFHVSSFLKSVM